MICSVDKDGRTFLNQQMETNASYNLTVRDVVGNRYVENRIILKWIFTKYVLRAVMPYCCGLGDKPFGCCHS